MKLFASTNLMIVLGYLVIGCAHAEHHDVLASWEPLFNGKNLDGWTHVGPGEFVVANGLLKTSGGMGLLWYNREAFHDVTLRVVYHVEKPPAPGNSGVFIRIPSPPEEPWMPVNKGYEVQIDELDDDYHRTGVLYSFTQARAKPPLRDWNVMEISLQGKRTVVTVNGEVVTDFTEGDAVPAKSKQWEPERGPRPNTGYIGLQNHSGKDVVSFREVSVLKR